MTKDKSRDTVMGSCGHNVPREFFGLAGALESLPGVDGVRSYTFIQLPRKGKNCLEPIGYAERDHLYLLKITGKKYTQKFALIVRPENLSIFEKALSSYSPL